MATEYPIFSTINLGVLIALGALFVATIGSTVAFALSKQRKKLWYSVTLVLAFLCLIVGAGCIALALR